MRQIGVRELAAKLAANEPIFLVDVRQPWEHETAAIPNSVLLPLGELMGKAQTLSPPSGAMTIVYCHHGVRSLSGAALLEQFGYENVASLSGGIDAWSCEVDRSVPRY